MRASAATAPVDRLGLQCHVDDPFLVARGTKKGRTIEFGCILVLWRALNCCLAWNKGALGQCVEWIGGSLRLNVGHSNEDDDAVIVSIGEAKLIKVHKIATALQDESMVDRTRVKEFAGLCSWIGSIVPNVNPFTQMLWAAASAKPSVNESQQKISTSRVRLPLQWLHAMARDRTIDAKRIFHIRERPGRSWITFDASLTGGGATLHLNKDVTEPATEFFSTTWTSEDHRCIGAQEGDPSFQAHWESYALLVACITWKARLQEARTSLSFRGDAKGVLQGVLARRAKNPGINKIVAETMLVLSETAHEFAAVHFWSEDNAVCDMLSRREEAGFMKPRELAQSRECEACRKEPWEFLPGNVRDDPKQ